MNSYQILELILEALADGRQEGESITDYKKRKANELEKHFANKEEEARTKARAYNHQYKKEKKEWKNNPQIGAEKALDTADKAFNNMIKSSDARRKKWEVQGIKKKMNENEALEIMEEIISEVSLGKWKEAAKSSLPKRKENAEIADKATEKAWDEYDKNARKYPEEEPHLYTLAVKNDEANIKAKRRAEHAEDVTNIGSKDKASANKVVKAAKKVQDKREDAFGRNPSARTLKRSIEANKAAEADPVKSRTNEALEIMENIVKQVEKKYGKLFDGKINARGRDLHKQVIANDVNEIISAAKRNLPDEEKNSSLAIDKEYDKIQNKRTSNKNKVGQAKTDARRPGSLHDQMQEIKNRKEDAAKGYPKAIEKSIKRHDKKMDEALELMEQICDFADNLFELDLEQKQNISPNKVSRVKKDKNGEKVEVVSVADELFPYEGDAKQQFNQKVLAKINDMIEGTGSLEDLIQFVRKGVAMKKQNAHEGYEEVEGILEDLYNTIKKKYGEPKYKGSTSEPANKSAELIDKSDDAKGKEYSQEKEKNPDINLYNKRYQTKNTKGEKETELRSSKYRKFSDDWKLPKSDKEKVEASIERHEKKLNKSEALGTLEEIKTLAEGLFKKDERGDLLNDIDTTLGSPVKKKLSDIKAKMTGCKETKVAENLNDQIDKKLKKGEIDIDKAFKLAQKIQNEMSTAKKGEEYMDVLNKRAKKEGLDDKAIAKSIRRNEKSKWQTT